MTPERDQQSAQHPERPPGRFKSALRVLRGQSLVPDQIVWEWVEYQQQFNDLLTRFSALLARQAKADKKRAREHLPDASHREVAPPRSGSHKEVLRKRAASLRGLSPSYASSPDYPPPAQLDLPPPPPPPEKDP